MSGFHVEIDGPVLTLTIDRGKANAIDAPTSREMGSVFESFRDDPALRVAIITGSGERFFSAGWDLGAAVDGEDYESDYGAGGFGGFPELPGLNKPVIAAVNGMAVGGGFEMAMNAHLVVAAERAEFLLPETAVGIIPDVGTVVLPRRLPYQLAMEMLLLGKRMSAHEAHVHGLVNRVVPAHELMETARTLANEVVSKAPLAVAAILDLVNRFDGLNKAQAYELMRSGTVDSYERMLASEDAVEGPLAFTEKRPPRWRGR